MPSNISEKISGGSFQYAEMHAGYTQGIKPIQESPTSGDPILETICRGQQQKSGVSKGRAGLHD